MSETPKVDSASPGPPQPHPGYSGIRAVMAEGARVGFLVCLRCGAALLLEQADIDAGVNVIEVHDAWHQEYP